MKLRVKRKIVGMFKSLKFNNNGRNTIANISQKTILDDPESSPNNQFFGNDSISEPIVKYKLRNGQKNSQKSVTLPAVQ